MKLIEFLDKELKCLGHQIYIEASYFNIPENTYSIYIIPDGQEGYCGKNE